ncbi:MAG TPA: hypothetical protein VGG48_08090 [Rhizomicrobium sp.]|jgi:hypothetical protein
MGKRIMAALVGGLLVGTLDIFVACAISQVPPDVVLHFIAAGLIGRDAAFHGGMPTVALGVALQEFISVVAAGVYVAASTRLPTLLRNPIPWGLAYGAAVNIVLTFGVQPLSYVARTHPIVWPGILENLAANMVLFGVPIALIARSFLRDEA